MRPTSFRHPFKLYTQLKALPSSPLKPIAPLIRNMSSQSLPPVLKKPVKLACIQLASGPDKAANLKHAASQVRQAASNGSNIIILPECFNSPYGCQFFPDYAETLSLPSSVPPTEEQSPSYHALSSMAADNKIYLIGGSIPELCPNSKKYFNTSLTFGPDGKLLGTHRKVHLFDIDIPGKITFKESDVLSPGNKVTLIDLPEYGTIAVAICYDVRFPELATIAARKGAFALIYPGAFNLTTGALHWKLLAQSRAVDNQIYVAMCSPARDMSASYNAWGHSMIVDPMAKVLVEAEETEAIIETELEGGVIAETRKNIPLSTQRRFDVYPDVSEGTVQFKEPSR
ncbi:Omega-amidase nit3 [Conoideocrella luteorostrata]|uniref:Omega-amidase nit3 n=1 Tax=Conoideocrella luteorostrata TaxID=1105319 RepID=A0AAJ0FXJ8_9HYPO|nr:Omega-amidase nit3 [Conoideocrella luteorostrata]